MVDAGLKDITSNAAKTIYGNADLHGAVSPFAQGKVLLIPRLREEDEREAALVTFLVTASGLALFGIGAAFCGLLAGVVVRLVLKPRVARV